jgi:excisionase family DNA binding protein
MGKNGLLTLQEAAAFTGKSERTLYRYIKQGKINCQTVSDGDRHSVRLKKEELSKLFNIYVRQCQTRSDRLSDNCQTMSDTLSDNVRQEVITEDRLENKMFEVMEKFFTRKQSELLKPLEDQAMFIAGKLTKENVFLKQRLDTVLEENRQLNDQIKALPGPAESIEQILKENTQNLMLLQKEKEDLLTRVEKQTIELEEYRPLLTQLEDTARKLQEKEETLKELEARQQREKAELEGKLKQEEEEKAKIKAEAEEEKKIIVEAWKKELELAKKPWWMFW